jgi:fatty-acyl-CoA synthase
MTPTPTSNDQLPLRLGGFASLPEALDYAARGKTGYNFHSARGALARALSYAELRERAIDVARGFIKAGLQPGARVVLVADTDPDFTILFFACQYASLLGVPVALPTTLGGREAYVAGLRRQLAGSGASAAAAPAELLSYLQEAAAGLAIPLVGAPRNSTTCRATAPIPGPSDPTTTAISSIRRAARARRWASTSRSAC